MASRLKRITLPDRVWWMGTGYVLFLFLQLVERRGLENIYLLSGLVLLTGVAILSGACEALVEATEGFSARLRWDTYVGGALAEIVSTLPEIVVITLVVMVSPLTALRWQIGSKS